MNNPYKIRDIKILFKNGDKEELDRGYLHVSSDYPGQYRLVCWNVSDPDILFKTTSETIDRLKSTFIPTYGHRSINYYNDDEWLEQGEYSPEAIEQKQKDRERKREEEKKTQRRWWEFWKKQ